MTPKMYYVQTNNIVIYNYLPCVALMCVKPNILYLQCPHSDNNHRFISVGLIQPKLFIIMYNVFSLISPITVAESIKCYYLFWILITAPKQKHNPNTKLLLSPFQRLINGGSKLLYIPYLHLTPWTEISPIPEQFRWT